MNDTESEPSTKQTMSPDRRKKLTKLVVFLIFIAVILVAFLHFQIHNSLVDFLEWVDDHQAEGACIYIVVYALCAVLFIPGTILSLGAGVVFGLWLGIVVVWIGATIGQTLAFIFGRYLLRETVEKSLEKYEKWTAVEMAVAKEGWKLVFLLRLAPAIPYNALNYVLGLTAVPLTHYTISSSLGIIPGVVLFVYIGSLAMDLGELASGDNALDGTQFLATLIVSGVMIVAVVVLTTIYAKKALAKSLGDVTVDEENPTVSTPVGGIKDSQTELSTLIKESENREPVGQPLQRAVAQVH